METYLEDKDIFGAIDRTLEELETGSNSKGMKAYCTKQRKARAAIIPAVEPSQWFTAHWLDEKGEQ